MNARARNRSAAGPERLAPEIGPYRRSQLSLSQHQITTELGRTNVTVDDAESPLVWLARRKGRDGRALIAPHQLQAGERLRRDFTCAHLMPRTTSNWDSPLSSTRANPDASATDVAMAARQRVHRALDAVGPEFGGLLVDVCCFLKRLEDIEQERVWPARSAKVVLQLALTQLARHYGYSEQANGARRGRLRTWLADDETLKPGGD